MKQILIKFPDDITDEQAMAYVSTVIKQGKISKNNTKYCYVTVFSDGMRVSANDRSRYPSFVLWRIGGPPFKIPEQPTIGEMIGSKY